MRKVNLKWYLVHCEELKFVRLNVTDKNDTTAVIIDSKRNKYKGGYHVLPITSVNGAVIRTSGAVPMSFDFATGPKFFIKDLVLSHTSRPFKYDVPLEYIDNHIVWWSKAEELSGVTNRDYLYMDPYGCSLNAENALKEGTAPIFTDQLRVGKKFIDAHFVIEENNGYLTKKYLKIDTTIRITVSKTDIDSGVVLKANVSIKNGHIVLSLQEGIVDLSTAPPRKDFQQVGNRWRAVEKLRDGRWKVEHEDMAKRINVLIAAEQLRDSIPLESLSRMIHTNSSVGKIGVSKGDSVFVFGDTYHALRPDTLLITPDGVGFKTGPHEPGVLGTMKFYYRMLLRWINLAS